MFKLTIFPFPYSYDPNEVDKCTIALITNDVIESTMLLSMTVASIWVYYYMTKLDVNPSPISKLDDMLLFLCIPFFLLYCIMNLVAAFDQKSDDHIPDLSSSIATNMLMVCVAIMNFIIFLFKTKHTALKLEKSAIWRIK